MRLLVLEDDPKLLEGYVRHLRKDGHAVDGAATLAEARELLDNAAYDVVVLDRLLPDGDGLSLLRELPPPQPDGEPAAYTTQGVPVLVLSALGSTDDRVAGFREGVTDYVPKPVRLDELTMRVARLLEHPVRGPAVTCRIGPVEILQDRREVRLHGKPVHLTATQLGILEMLVVHQDRLVTNQELIDHCWDRNEPIRGNPVHPHISRLRKIFAGVLSFDVSRGTGYSISLVEDTDAGSDADS